MQLIEIGENQKEKYQSFVQANGYFLQDWDWGDFQKSIGKNIFRFALIDNDEIVCSTQLQKTAVRNKSYLFCPYGPVFKKGISNAVLAEQLEKFAEQLKAKFPEALFLRTEIQREVSDLPMEKSIDLDPHKTLLLDLNKDSETLLEEMHQKTRYNIKLAQKKEIQVKISEQIDPANNPFDRSMQRAGVKGYGVKYYNDLLNFFSESKNIAAKLYTASHENDLLAANIMLFWNGVCIYLFGGSSDLKRNLMPTYLLHWQAILDAKSQAFKSYDFWGVEEDPKHPWHGFSKFKLGFGGTVVKYAGTMDWVYSPAWYNVYRVFRKINRKTR